MSRNVLSLAFSDLAMVLSTGISFPFAKLFRNGPRVFQWRNGGFWLQSIYQAGWLALWTQWPFLLQWTWTAQVFFALHTLTFLMKMHSYAFYNGHLSETERRLRSLDRPETANLAAVVKYPSSPTRLAQDDESEESIEEKLEKEERLDQL